jgi:hypothetical protein
MAASPVARALSPARNDLKGRGFSRTDALSLLSSRAAALAAARGLTSACVVVAASRSISALCGACAPAREIITRRAEVLS